jgi:hypothetical protein
MWGFSHAVVFRDSFAENGHKMIDFVLPLSDKSDLQLLNLLIRMVRNEMGLFWR